MALDFCQNFVFAQYFENKLTVLPSFIEQFILTRFRLGLLAVIFCLHHRVMVLDLCQNFVSTQYLENKWLEFRQILYIYIDNILIGIVTCYFLLIL